MPLWVHVCRPRLVRTSYDVTVTGSLCPGLTGRTDLTDSGMSGGCGVPTPVALVFSFVRRPLRPADRGEGDGD